MSTAQSNYLLSNAILRFNEYGKQAFFMLMLVLLVVALLDPNMTVLANGATSNAGG